MAQRIMPVQRFQELKLCADGSERAHQPFRAWAELWIFTGSRCNLGCSGCYTASSPQNDAFRFVTLEQARQFLEEARELGVPKICYTGGEPFFNPYFPAILDLTLELGFECLVLTNLTKPYEARGKTAVERHVAAGRPLQIRASLDHPDPAIHEELHLDTATIHRYPVPPILNTVRRYWFDSGFNRGRGNFRRTLVNLMHLSRKGARVSVAGRGPRRVGERLFRVYVEETEPRFRDLFERHGLPAGLPLRIFPDIGQRLDTDVPEISEHRCREIIPESVFSGLMCNRTRMVAVPSTWGGKSNGGALVFPCTIVLDNPAMALGMTLREAMQQETYLADPRCYRFCISGESSCSEA